MMTLSNAERQRRWRERREQMARLGEMTEDSIGQFAKIADRLGSDITLAFYTGSVAKDFSEMLGEQAEWRESLTEQFPDDERNMEASKHCRWLSEQFNNLEETPKAFIFAECLLRLLDRIEDAIASPEIGRLHSEFMREVGFHVHYESAEELLVEYADTVVLEGIKWVDLDSEG